MAGFRREINPDAERWRFVLALHHDFCAPDGVCGEILRKLNDINAPSAIRPN
jgi:hypothetical protein